MISTNAAQHENVRGQPFGLADSDRLALTLKRAGSLVFHLQRRRGMQAASDVELTCRAGGTTRLAKYASGERLLLDQLPAGRVEVSVRTADGFERVVQPHVELGATRTVIVRF